MTLDAIVHQDSRANVVKRRSICVCRNHASTEPVLIACTIMNVSAIRVGLVRLVTLTSTIVQLNLAKMTEYVLTWSTVINVIVNQDILARTANTRSMTANLIHARTEQLVLISLKDSFANVDLVSLDFNAKLKLTSA